MIKNGVFNTRRAFYGLLLVVLITLGNTPGSVRARQPGIGPTTIRLAGVMDLKGRSRGLGQGMKRGLTAAFDGELVQGRSLELDILDDSYEPTKTIEATNQLLDTEPFLFVGNVGTPTAKVALPILADERVPAVGFFTGSEILRPGRGDILNYRASYVQEIKAVIDAALANGYMTDEVCGYVQNDAYGMAGVLGIKLALRGKPRTAEISRSLDQILAQSGTEPERNGLGPIGVYRRNTYTARSGYLSLKNWEEKRGTRCRLIVTTGSYSSIAKFIAYAKYKGEEWVYSALSFTGAHNFHGELDNVRITDRVVMTQVVPDLDSDLPIAIEARKALGNDFGYVTFEGFIVGRMLINILNTIEGTLTRRGLMNAALGQQFDLGGLKIDFSDDNQASDLVSITQFTPGGWISMTDQQWRAWHDD